MVHSVLKIAKISSCCTRTNTSTKSEATTEGYKETMARNVFGRMALLYNGGTGPAEAREYGSTPNFQKFMVLHAHQHVDKK